MLNKVLNVLPLNGGKIVGAAIGTAGAILLFGLSFVPVVSGIAICGFIGSFFDMPADPMGTGSTPDSAE